MMLFKSDPMSWFTGSAFDEAVEHLAKYMATYTGRFFERFASLSDPDRFEATDIVAVSCLAVNVPAAVSAWLLLDEGRLETAALLEQIGTGFTGTLWDHDLAADRAAADLWRLLSCQRSMGPTTVSKLMAVKRPHLVPIYDSYVADALVPGGLGHRWEWWRPWRERVTAADGEQLRSAVETVRDSVARRGVDVSGLSLLRVIDIVIWRSEEQRRRQRLG